MLQRWTKRLARGRVPEPDLAFPFRVMGSCQNGLTVGTESQRPDVAILFCAWVHEQLSDRFAGGRVQKQDLVLSTALIPGCRQDGSTIGTERQAAFPGGLIPKPSYKIPRGGIPHFQISRRPYGCDDGLPVGTKGRAERL